MKLSDATTMTQNALASLNILVVNEGLSVVAGTLILVVGWVVVCAGAYGSPALLMRSYQSPAVGVSK